MNDKKTLGRLVRPARGRVVLLSALTLCNAVFQVALALLMRYVIDAAVYQKEELPFWGVLLAVDLLALVVLNCWINWLSGSTSDQLTAKLRGRLLESAAYCADVRLQGFHSGQLLSRGMEDVRTVCDGVVHALPSLIGQLTRLLGAFAAVFLLERRLAYLLAVVAVVMVVAVGLLRTVLKGYHRKVRQSDEKVLSAMQEDLQQLELIQSLQAQPEILDRFDARVKENLSVKAKRRVFHVGVNAITNICTMTGTGILLLWGAGQVATKVMSYGTLTAMLQLLSMFRGPVLGLSGLWTRLTAVDVAAERLGELLTAPQNCTEAMVEDVEAIVFENVTFTYPGDEAPVLQNFSAVLPLEKWSCLTGMSGRGKSTMFKLILGLYTPESGRVYLKTGTGDVLCGENTRHLFAYVPQDYALFSGTIAENLLLVSQTTETGNALSMAQADFVWELPAGEQTQVRENNTGLSKGQLQRLAIARAILMDRPILLLDECTSALDAVTEEKVLKALHDFGKQAVLVTHRPEMTENLQDISRINMEN